MLYAGFKFHINVIKSLLFYINILYFIEDLAPETNDV